MKVIVFGATGSIGRNLIDQALGKRYSVTAFCRTPGALAATPGLSIAQGDVNNPEDVQKAIRGHDAVFIVLGSGNKRTSTIRSVGTKHVIDAMKEHGVRRLICQTTLGCGTSKGNLNFFWKYIMFGWYLKDVLLDHELQEEHVVNSGLEWTIIRPAAFTNGNKTARYKHGFRSDDKSLTLKISRADVADFMLRELESGQYIHKAPGLSY